MNPESWEVNVAWRITSNCDESAAVLAGPGGIDDKRLVEVFAEHGFACSTYPRERRGEIVADGGAGAAASECEQPAQPVANVEASPLGVVTLVEKPHVACKGVHPPKRTPLGPPVGSVSASAALPA